MKPGGVAFNGSSYGNGCSPTARPDVGDLSGCPLRSPRRPGGPGPREPSPAAPPPAPAARPAPRVPTPVEIATGLAPTVPLAGLTAHTSPPADRKQVTGFPVWLWLDGWAPRTVRRGGVTVTATPVSSTWDLVDTATSCAGPGEPYRSSVADPDRASTCSVTFTHSSRHTSHRHLPRPRDRHLAPRVDRAAPLGRRAAGPHEPPPPHAHRRRAPRRHRLTGRPPLTPSVAAFPEPGHHAARRPGRRAPATPAARRARPAPQPRSPTRRPPARGRRRSPAAPTPCGRP